VLALTEGSAAWAALVLAGAYLGFTGGYAAGDSPLATVRKAAESGNRPTALDHVRGAFDVRNLLLFWVPQLLF
jgi:hypothetical protein